jgi:PAS domain-containing protein
MTKARIDPSDRAARAPAATTQLLLAALDLLSEGAGVFDRDFRMVGCNARFSKLRGYPAALCRRGTPLGEFFRFHAEQGDYGSGDVAALVDARIEQARSLGVQEFERVLGDLRTIRVRYAHIPAGVLVTYTEPTLLAAHQRTTTC